MPDLTYMQFKCMKTCSLREISKTYMHQRIALNKIAFILGSASCFVVFMLIQTSKLVILKLFACGYTTRNLFKIR